MDIGLPKEVREIEPVTLPVPSKEPVPIAPGPAREPQPAATHRTSQGLPRIEC
jgi:hypothetical protein